MSSGQQTATTTVTSDPALDISCQHHHEYTHHGRTADTHTDNGPVYAHGILPDDKQVPPQFPLKDTESGVEAEKKGVPVDDIENGLIATYALCGFANIGSLGIQIGVLSQVAPSRSGDISRVAMSALISGAISTFTSASVAGLVVTNQRQFTTPTATT